MIEFRSTLFYKTITGFTDMSDESLSKLFSVVNRREFAKNEYLLEENAVCNSIFFIEAGSVRSFLHIDANEINTNFSFEGNYVTSLKSLRTSTPSEINIKAEEKSIVFEFKKDNLLELYKESVEVDAFGRNLLELLLMQQEEHANLFKIYSPAERYEYLRVNSPELLQRVSLSQLASYLGIARETLSRIRRKQ